MNKINVLHFICPTGLYGAERWILALANNINTRNVNCNLAVTLETPSQNLDLIKLYPSRVGRTFVLSMHGRFDVRIVNKLCRVIKDYNIDIIHTHGYKSDIIGLLTAKLTGKKAITTPHGFGNASDYKLRLYIYLGYHSLKYFDMVVPLSPELMEQVKHSGIAKSKLAYVQNGVDFDEIDNIHRLPYFNQNFYKENGFMTIGYIGQMIPRKNIKDILDTFDILWQRKPMIKLLLIGDGVERDPLETYSRSLSSSKHIHFLGYQDNRLEILKTFDLFVLTSSYEGIPRCLMEAMAMGIPVSAYDISGVDQLINNDINGLLSPFGDREKLAANWEKLLFNKSYASRISSAGRDYILTNFSAKRMANEYVEIYQSILR
jgi:glycosyltransferase involved in cell wall biosynthesis